MPFWLPNGTVLLRLIEREVREQLVKRGYEEIKTPQVLDEELWHRSGHWDNYRENMYFVEPVPARGRRAPLRAQADELPRRLPRLRAPSATPIASCRCAWPSSATSRATSARASCTGCCGSAPSPRTTPTSTARSTRSPTRSTRSARRSTSSTRASASTRCGSSSRPGPEKSIGTDEQWERATAALREALERQGREYDVSPGEGTFYGPKIDFHVTDALGRSWQCGTCQLDFQMPERFELTYQGEDNAEHRPVMIHRALLGLDGALRRDPDRAPRRPLPGLARARPGGRPAGLRPPPRLRAARSPASSARPRRAGARRRPLGVGRAARSATPSSRRCRSCSSSASARRPTATASVRSHERGDLGAVAVDEIPALIGCDALEA